MVWTVLYTPGIRFFEGLAAAAPTLLIGIVLAGLLRAMAGPEQIRRLFGGADHRGLARTFLVAALLPVGSLGMLPIAREMARARVPLANLVLLAVVAPLLSPLAVVHGLTSLAGSTLALLAAAAVLAGLGAWLLVPRLDREKAPTDPPPTAATPLRRVLNTGLAVSRIASGMTLVDVLVALGFGALGLRELGHWEDQARKLPMAALLRGRRPPPEGRQAVDDFLRQAERLRQAMLSNRPSEERLQIARDAMEAHARCGKAFGDRDLRVSRRK